MSYIDFSTIPKIHEKISEEEIKKLNEIFQSPGIVKKLSNIEKNRIIRKFVYFFVTIIFGVVFFSISIYNLNSGEFTNSTLYLFLLFLCTLLGVYRIVYIFFRKKIEIPLKRDILSLLGIAIHPTYEYSYDEKYSFNDLEFLVQKDFLNSYTNIETVEDSFVFKIEQTGKSFFLNGFELVTTKITKTRTKRKISVTNDNYLVRIVFPLARIGLKSDIYIAPDKKFFLNPQDDVAGNGIPVIVLISFGILFFFIFILIWVGTIGNFWLGCFLFGGLVYIFSKFLKKQHHIPVENKITLENDEFEKTYDVFCNDEISSRMILTPIFIEKLLNFTKKTGNYYSFLFTNDKIYIKKNISGKHYMEVKTADNLLKNIDSYLDFYIAMKEFFIFAGELHLMYLSQTHDISIIDSHYEKNPIILKQSQSITDFFPFFEK